MHISAFILKHLNMHSLKTTTSLLVLFALCLGFSSCKKGATACSNPVSAIILDRGPVSGDGCGWVVCIDSILQIRPISTAG